MYVKKTQLLRKATVKPKKEIQKNLITGGLSNGMTINSTILLEFNLLLLFWFYTYKGDFLIFYYIEISKEVGSFNENKK